MRENRRTMISPDGGRRLLLHLRLWLVRWAPTYFVRDFGWKYAEIGKVLGLLLAIARPGGRDVRRMARRLLEAPRRRAWLPARRARRGRGSRRRRRSAW